MIYYTKVPTDHIAEQSYTYKYKFRNILLYLNLFKFLTFLSNIIMFSPTCLRISIRNLNLFTDVFPDAEIHVCDQN